MTTPRRTYFRYAAFGVSGLDTEVVPAPGAGYRTVIQKVVLYNEAQAANLASFSWGPIFTTLDIAFGTVMDSKWNDPTTIGGATTREIGPVNTALNVTTADVISYVAWGYVEEIEGGDPEFTPVAHLTRHFDNGAQLLMWPGFWTPDPSNPTYFRTNQVLQMATVCVTGYTTLTAKFGSACYSDPVNTSVGLLAVRRSTTQDGLWAAEWTYGVQPDVNDANGTTLYSDLDPNAFTYVQWATCLPTFNLDGTVAFGPTYQPGDPVVGTDYGEFWDFLGYGHNDSATGRFHSIYWNRPRKNFIIFGDSHSHGRVRPTGGVSTDKTIAEPRVALLNFSAILASDVWDQRGALAGYPWLLINNFCQRNGFIPVVSNRSWGGYWLTKMSPTMRALHQILWPDVFADLDQVFKYRTDYGNTDMTSREDWTRGLFVPDVVMLGCYGNNKIQRGVEKSVPPDLHYFDGTFQRDSVGRDDGSPESVVHLFFTQWPGARLFSWYFPKNDGVYVSGETNKADITAGLAGSLANHYQFGRDQRDWKLNRGRFIDLTTKAAITTIVASNPDIADLHYNAEKNELIRQALQEDFDAIAKF